VSHSLYRAGMKNRVRKREKIAKDMMSQKQEETNSIKF
jgi:hypothetical protein